MAKKVLFYVVVAAALIMAFDHMMKKDAENLCSNDETAYEGCSN